MFSIKAKAKCAAYIPPHSASSTLWVVYKLIMQATHCPPQWAGYSFYWPQKDRRLSQPWANYLGSNPGSWAQFWLQYSSLTIPPLYAPFWHSTRAAVCCVQLGAPMIILFCSLCSWLIHTQIVEDNLCVYVFVCFHKLVYHPISGGHNPGEFTSKNKDNI